MIVALVVILWIAIGFFCAYKESKALKTNICLHGFIVLIMVIAPIWLLITMINLTFFKSW